MTMELFAHPFSSYCQKVLIALREKGLDFELRLLEPDQTVTQAEFARLWPLQRMPLLRAGETVLMESTLIIEWLDLQHPDAPRLLPADPQAALQVRLFDRLFDQYVMTPMQKLVFDCIRPAEKRDPHGVAEAHALLEKAYAWLDGQLPAAGWAVGQCFSLADCAAAPSLFYADWVHEIPPELHRLRAYRQRLLAHPSVARAVDEGRPYRSWFPPGAPDRD
ncbi:glutathione S-transferase family protein [Inhella proteolytica]|uniref:Glutathione S-transferase family protein n=1 Tax=Inhella proteolytica TaxID=2795029 RepID=A0A931J861_9BURK|nr:glutathione S-transferase family protein [Inhella proteolytica]MBH9579329.1 glutathione S-transferase family protein [Inhella proteolytica]